jgi:GR25 family glycosyltransferase involved in LPS biosynthesis
MKFYCLHHSPAIERKQYLLKAFEAQEILPEWIESYLPDSSEVNSQGNIFSYHAANGSFLNKAEISCFLKHKEAIARIASGGEHGIILEDDIENPDFSIKEVCDGLREYCADDVIIFIGSFTGADLPSLAGKLKFQILMSKSFKSRCAHAYMLNSNTAKKILPELETIVMPLDWQLNHIIDKLELNVGWTSPHINQRTEKGYIKSLLR